MNAHHDQWREMIILIAGLASKALSEQLIDGLIKRGDKEKSYHHLLHLLAVSCLETVIELRSELRAEVEKRLKQLVPPKNMTEAKAVAAAGELAVKHLVRKEKLSASICAACVRTLALIGSDTALDALETYADDTREGVRKEFFRAWEAFDRRTFAKRMLPHISSMVLERVSTLQGFQYATNLTSLLLAECHELTDLSPLAGLTNLTSLTLTACYQLTDLRPLAGLTSLAVLTLFECHELTDLDPLVSFDQLG